MQNGRVISVLQPFAQHCRKHKEEQIKPTPSLPSSLSLPLKCQSYLQAIVDIAEVERSVHRCAHTHTLTHKHSRAKRSGELGQASCWNTRLLASLPLAQPWTVLSLLEGCIPSGLDRMTWCFCQATWLNFGNFIQFYLIYPTLSETHTKKQNSQVYLECNRTAYFKSLDENSKSVFSKAALHFAISSYIR